MRLTWRLALNLTLRSTLNLTLRLTLSRNENVALVETGGFTDDDANRSGSRLQDGDRFLVRHGREVRSVYLRRRQDGSSISLDVSARPSFLEIVDDNFRWI